MASPRGALMEVLRGQSTEGLKLRSNVVRVFVSSTFTGKQFEVLLSKLPQDQVGLLHQWFRKDNNAVPPVYVLQPITTLLPHYNDLQPERRPLQDDSVISWRYTEARLLQLLRTAAVQAEEDGDITVEQKHQFFKSVAEHEIEEGLRMPDGDESEPSAILFVRELPHLRKKDGLKRLAQYMDVTADGLLDTEAQDLLSGLKSRLFTASPGILNLHSVELCKGAIEPSCKEHAQYLESLCEQLVSQTKARIARRVGAGSSVEAGAVMTNGARGGDASQRKGEEDRGWLLQELSHHMALSAGKCSSVFRGREGLLGKICLAMWEHTNTRHAPLVVHGPPGVGKTTLLCKLAQEMRGLLDPRAVVVLRLLGTSAESSDLGRVLQSVCFQICSVFSLSPPTPITAHTREDLVRFFHGLLAEVSERGDTLLLILDSLDQLSSATQGQKLHWLPKDIPPNVHLVVSTADTGSPVLANLRRTVEVPGNFFEVEPLSCDQGREIMDAYMREAQRSLTPEQCEVVLCSFQLSGNPLHLKLLLDMARRWASYTPVTDLALSSSAQEVMSQLLQALEERHGKQLVGAALGYIVSARGSLSEAELRDILSLDNNVLAEVYQYWLPPNHSLIRLPPLLWVRLRHDLGELLVEGQANGVTVLDFHHKLLTETVRERYQRSEQQADRHRVLAEYFLGRWSQGLFKAVLLPPLTTTLDADRKVPPQPLWFAEGVANVKKLQELPYHLLHAGLWEELRQEVIGSSEWLYCKTLTCGVASVIEDLTLCTELMDCPETQLIRDTFILLKPTLDFLDGQMDPSLFYTEVLARLHSFAEMYPSLIGRLCCQCHDWLSCCPDPILVPKCAFLQPPGGALKTTLAGFQKGITALDICPERGILLAGSEDGKVIAWDLNDLEVIQTLVGHTAKVLSVRVIDSGAHCLSLAADGSLRKWSLLSGRQLYCTQEAVSINSLPSTTHIHVSEERALVFTHSGGQSFLDLHHEDTVLCACVSSDSRVVVSGSEDQTIRVWSITTGNLLDSFLGMDAPVTTLALYEGTVVSASSSAYYLKLWHLPSPNDPQQRPKGCIPAGCPQVALTKDGSSTDTMAVSAEVCCLELAQHNKLLFCGLTTGTVLIYPLAFPKETLCIPPPETLPTVRCMAIGGQEKHMAVAYEDSVCLFEITARDSFPSVEGPAARFALSLLHSPVSSMALLPDCRLLYGTACGEVTMYDFKSTSTATLDGHRSRVNCVTTSNWGTHALVGSEDAVQRLWGLTPLVLDHTMEYKGFLFEGVLCAAFSESDKHVFTGSQDRTIKVWDVASGSLLFVQYVYAPVTKMLTYRNGFVAISQLGYVIKEGFRCPDDVCPEYNPLRNINAHYRVTSRQKSADSPHSVITKIPEYNPAQFNFMALMLKSKPSHSCQLL
ncbi:NACHT domain- and WD repeat-containing protein 1 [Salvelinus namaycush]|uniref:NACHT domain- and WD repeat-containing protein 1 n=1 Tax=Salvelinus namaycush TaxID=8040 RepID=A0A8U1BKL4_SALNM|nr:NACHT domain- and WD repeat-containing protein 1 [Salvelinus namaycush]